MSADPQLKSEQQTADQPSQALQQPPNNLPATAEPKKAPVPILVGERGLRLNSIEAMWRFANYVLAAGFAPKGMDKPEAVLVAIQLGAEIGMSPMASLQNVAVINGRPGIFGDAALGIVRSSGLMEGYSQRLEGEGDGRKAVVTSKRRGEEPLTPRKLGYGASKGPGRSTRIACSPFELEASISATTSATC
jgi:hypothetical protein